MRTNGGLHLLVFLISLFICMATPVAGQSPNTATMIVVVEDQTGGVLKDDRVSVVNNATGAGSRRTTTVTLDGANNDEAWGRQTMIATIPLGAIQEMTILSNAFSSEFGWTAGPALNIVTKSGTNGYHGEGLFMSRPGNM